MRKLESLVVIFLIHAHFGNSSTLRAKSYFNFVNGNHINEVDNHVESIPINPQFSRVSHCGVVDNAYGPLSLSRPGSADLLQKWHSNEVSWRFDHNYGPYRENVSQIRRILYQAFQIWSEVSVLTFHEVGERSSADIRISFQRPSHPELDTSLMDGMVLAHAFLPYPGDELSGDIHFREDLKWNFDVTNEDDAPHGQENFFAVAVHEIGHAIGLNHVNNTNSIMYGAFHSPAVLSDIDINNIQMLYGVPQGRRRTTKRPQIRTTTPETREKLDLPEKCNTNYDAITKIRGELFIFKGRYMFRPAFESDAYEIRSMWTELPENFEKIDAVYEDFKGKLSFFIGRDVFIFEDLKLSKKLTLEDFGISNRIDKIDAIFKWNHSKDKPYYIFSNGQFWKLRGEKVDPNYPKRINAYWRDVGNKYDTIYSDQNKLYFFKDKHFYEFDAFKMRLNLSSRQSSAQHFMKCPANSEYENSITWSSLRVEDYSEDVDIENTEEESSGSSKIRLALSHCVVLMSAVVIALCSKFSCS